MSKDVAVQMGGRDPSGIEVERNHVADAGILCSVLGRLLNRTSRTLQCT